MTVNTTFKKKDHLVQTFYQSCKKMFLFLLKKKKKPERSPFHFGNKLFNNSRSNEKSQTSAGRLLYRFELSFILSCSSLFQDLVPFLDSRLFCN